MRECPRFGVWSDLVPGDCRPSLQDRPCEKCELWTLRNRFASWLFRRLFKKPKPQMITLSGRGVDNLLRDIAEGKYTRPEDKEKPWGGVE